jgi:hypothetical protein
VADIVTVLRDHAYLEEKLSPPVTVNITLETNLVRIEAEIDGHHVGSAQLEVSGEAGADRRLKLHVWRQQDDEPHRTLYLFKLGDDPRSQSDLELAQAGKDRSDGLQ